MSKGLCEENTFDIIHKYSEKELADIIYEFGEEYVKKIGDIDDDDNKGEKLKKGNNKEKKKSKFC